MRTIAMRAAVALALLAPAASRAVDVGDGILSINANAEWWYGQSDRNRFLGADSDGTWRNEMFDLLLTGHPREDLTVSAQLGLDRTGTASLEWMFGEWRVRDALRLRAGKVKQPLGNYAELQFVGTSRPFLTLATSVYGPADIVTTAVTGVGLTGAVRFGKTELAYDLYGGTQDLVGFDTFFVLRPEFAPGSPSLPPELDTGRPIANRSQLVENVMGGRLSLTLPFDLVLRASAWTGHLEKFDDGYPKDRTVVYGLSAWYRNDKLWLSAEGFRANEHGWSDQWSGYAEVAYFVYAERLQVSGRYEIARVKIPGYALGSDPLLRHDETSIGLGWWFTPQAVVKASAHLVEGKRFTRYEGEFASFGAVPSERTNLYLVGAAFTY